MNEEWKILLSAYHDGELSKEEAAAAEKLLAERPECLQYLNELRAVSSHLQILKDESLSPDAEIKIQQKAKKESFMKIQTLKAMPLLVIALLTGTVVVQNITKRNYNGPLKTAAIDDIRDQFSPGNTNVGSATVPAASYTMDKAKEGKSFYDAGQRQEVAALEKGMLAPQTSDESQVLSRAEVDTLAAQSFSSYAAPAKIAMGLVASDEIYPVSPVPMPYPYQQYADGNTEEYNKINENAFLDSAQNPLSTFSLDVDTASYSNVRRFLTQNQMPPADAVRLEEMINYFSYDYPKPEGKDPFSITTDLAICPWNKDHQLLRIGLKGRTPDTSKLPASNLVFLIDVSGSMNDQDKLPLLKEGFKMMVNQLRAEDKVSIVTYAGNAGVVLEPTSGDQKEKIKAALDNLQAGGSTAGSAGMNRAYELAKQNFIKDGNNRVVWATDGDFNVGISSTSELVRAMEEKRKDGIFLTLLGFGQGNIKDSRMQQVADQGNGNYYYIDNIKEARKVLVNELGSTLYTIAKDVKVQIEFNPAAVESYRLVGYEKRLLAKEDFNNDKKDAGEIGAGHTVTALYELVPAGSKDTTPSVDALKYQKTQPVSSDEVMTVKLRYKEPDEDTSKLLSRTIGKSDVKKEPAGDFAWAASVTEFGMLLRNSEFKGTATYDEVIKAAKANTGEDKHGLRAEFITLVEAAQTIAPSGNGQMQFK